MIHSFKAFNLSCFILISSVFAQVQCSADEPFFPKLVVSGSSMFYKPANQLSITVSVVTQGETASKSLEANNLKMQAVIDNLKKTGLAKGEYQTGRFNIEPVYSIPPKNPPQDWKAVITGYDVTNSLNVRTPKLELAPAIIDAASAAGANKIANINFDLKDPQIYRTEAISAATANAIADATALANAANLKLVRVLNISMERPQIYPRVEKMGFALAANETPIVAGDVEVSANVSITYEISTK